MATQVQASDNVKDGVFIHISHISDGPHRLLISLNMVQLLADYHDVLVYLDIKGVDAVLKDSPDINYSHFPSTKTQFNVLLKQEVTLMVCPECLKAAWEKPKGVPKGVRSPTRKRFSISQKAES